MSEDYMSDGAPISARKKLVYQLSAINRAVPEVAIFDEPARCYRINKQWARIIMGLVSLLVEPEMWLEAEDDTYPPLNEIRLFLAQNEACCMTCEELQACLAASQTIIDLQTQINNINDYVVYGGVQIDIDNTTVDSVFTPAQQAENIGGDPLPPALGETCNKDSVWGACNQLVEYINQNNVDFLQQVSQATNVSAQAERAIGAIPLIGVLPIDELIGTVDWYADAAYSEYNATVDTDLLTQTKCDLFCIATSSNNCGLSFANLITYFADKVAPSAGSAVDTFANLIQFALTGTFSGDDYFYYMCYFQLWIAYAGERFLNNRGVQNYAIQAAAGKNSPDNDWTLFCDACNDSEFSYIDYDFAVSDHDFYSTPDAAGQPNRGVYDAVNGYWYGVDGVQADILRIQKDFVIKPHIVGVAIEYSRLNSNGGAGNTHDFLIYGIPPAAPIASSENYQTPVTQRQAGMRIDTFATGGYVDSSQIFFKVRGEPNSSTTRIYRVRIYIRNAASPVTGTPCLESDIPPTSLLNDFAF